MGTREKLAFVTGASRGIGKAIATALADEGFLVAGGYHEHRSGIDDLEDNQENIWGVQVDIHSRVSIHQVVAAAEAHFGQSIDILVNNAAMADERAFEEITDAQWDRVLETNLRGPFILAQETLPAMAKRGWGRIVNIVSIGGQWGGMRQVHYAAAKAGLINFTQSIARLYARAGITSNAVSPGLVGTDMLQKELASDAGKAKVASIPVGRIARPDEIAAAVAFLCSDSAGYITGQTINVNGGMYFG
jgi:acetoacetyl-CoA reductase/3-oxoacyl-[acyl-carrier protein] reductase